MQDCLHIAILSRGTRRNRRSSSGGLLLLAQHRFQFSDPTLGPELCSGRVRLSVQFFSVPVSAGPNLDIAHNAVFREVRFLSFMQSLMTARSGLGFLYIQCGQGHLHASRCRPLLDECQGELVCAYRARPAQLPPASTNGRCNAPADRSGTCALCDGASYPFFLTRLANPPPRTKRESLWQTVRYFY